MAAPVEDGTAHGPTPLALARAAVRVGEPAFVAGRLHWLSSSPDGSGRTVLCSGAPEEPPRLESPLDVSIRSSLYGYGAAAWCPTERGPVGIDQRTQGLVSLAPSRVDPIGPAPSADSTRGDPVPIPGRPWVLLVAEDVATGTRSRGIVAVDLEHGTETWLHATDGRCGEPQVSADGTYVAWVEWPHRAMPWESASIWVARIERDAGGLALRGRRRVDGGRGSSAGQPTWRHDGSLAYVSEAAGWWQVWCCDDGGVVRRLTAHHAEFQRPRWLTCRWLATLGRDGSLACAYADRDGEHVGVLAPDGELAELDQPCVRVDGVAADDTTLGWVGATTRTQGVVLVSATLGPGATGVDAIVGDALDGAVGPRAPEPFSFVYDDVALEGVLWRATGGGVGPTPLVLTVHPGPTGAVDRSYAPIVELLTSNGIAVAAIDYSGSTAHGRAHRERLDGRFGVLDVEECTAAVAYLVAAGVATEATFLRGTSAGGTTSLLALAVGELRGAVAWYPASSFADDPEGFESGYLTTLLGADGATRTPASRAPAMHGSVLVVQGALDRIVTLPETESLVASLRSTLEDVSLVVVEGEAHGFRTEEGRAAALGAELAFYLRCIEGDAATVAGDGARARYDAASSERASDDDQRP